MLLKQHMMLFISIIVCAMMLSSITHSQEAKEKKFLMVPGDIHTPYDIVDGVGFVKEVEKDVSLFGSDAEKSLNSAVESAFQDLEKASKNINADAVINVQLQFVVLPGEKGNVCELLVFGTAIKFKTDK